MNWLALLHSMIGQDWAQHLQGTGHPLGVPNYLAAFHALHEAHPAAAHAGAAGISGFGSIAGNNTGQNWASNNLGMMGSPFGLYNRNA